MKTLSLQSPATHSFKLPFINCQFAENTGCEYETNGLMSEMNVTQLEGSWGSRNRSMFCRRSTLDLLLANGNRRELASLS